MSVILTFDYFLLRNTQTGRLRERGAPPAR